MAAGGVEIGGQHGKSEVKNRRIFCIQKLFVKQKDPKIAKIQTDFEYKD
jgi:hypothetical protein